MSKHTIKHTMLCRCKRYSSPGTGGGRAPPLHNPRPPDRRTQRTQTHTNARDAGEAARQARQAGRARASRRHRAKAPQTSVSFFPDLRSWRSSAFFRPPTRRRRRHDHPDQIRANTIMQIKCGAPVIDLTREETWLKRERRSMNEICMRGWRAKAAAEPASYLPTLAAARGRRPTELPTYIPLHASLELYRSGKNETQWHKRRARRCISSTRTSKFGRALRAGRMSGAAVGISPRQLPTRSAGGRAGGAGREDRAARLRMGV